VEYQFIPTIGAVDWESFTIGDMTFLAVANYNNGSTYNLDSKIYKWDGSKFMECQSIPTHGAYDWESFTIGTDTFLAVANYHNGSRYNLDSKIYHWPIRCEGDFDCDRDVDGSDLSVFAADFGRTDCVDDCDGDFDGDGDVDGSDLARFAASFGKTECPSCPLF